MLNLGSYLNGTIYLDQKYGREETLKESSDLNYVSLSDGSAVLTDGWGGSIWKDGVWSKIINETPILTHKGVEWSESTLKSMIDSKMK